MTDEHVVECDQHGPQPETFVCQHIVQSLASGQPVGFHWPADSNQECRDVWCSACHDRHERRGFEWAGDAGRVVVPAAAIAQRPAAVGSPGTRC